MWMDAYVEEILLRERIADTQRRAQFNHRLRGTTPARARRGVRELVARLLRRPARRVRHEAIDFHRPAGAAPKP